jgi:hypothetical protein
MTNSLRLSPEIAVQAPVNAFRFNALTLDLTACYGDKFIYGQ